MSLPAPIETFLKYGDKARGTSLRMRGCGLESASFDWRVSLGATVLTDRCWRVLLRHVRQLISAVISGGLIRSTTVRRVSQFHDVLVCVVEHLVIQHPEDVQALGLKALTHDRMITFLADYRFGGVSRTGCWLSRWSDFVVSRARRLGDIEEAQMVSSFSEPLRSQVLILGRSLQTHGAENGPAMPTLDLSDALLRKSRIWLAAHGWFDQWGRLPIGKVAEAIGASRSRVCPNPARFRYDLRPFELCTDYRDQDHFRSKRECIDVRTQSVANRALAPTAESSQNQIYSFFVTTARVASIIPALGPAFTTQLATQRVPQFLRGGPGGRTPTMPVATALFAFDRMIDWAINVTAPLCKLAAKVVRQSVEMRAAKPKTSGLASLKSALSNVEPPQVLRILGLHGGPAQCMRRKDDHGTGDGTTTLASEIRSEGMSLLDALALNSVILAALLGVFCMRRRTEVLSARIDGLLRFRRQSYLRFNMGKAGLDGGQDPRVRPIPTFLWNALCDARNLGLSICSSMDVGRVSEDAPLLWSFLRATKPPVKLRNDTLANYLTFFCDFIQLPVDQRGYRWYIRFHELRRFGALSFFRMSGMETSLPALSWMLGHDGIHQTWRYIQEELTGEELTETEVAMAHAALLGQQDVGAVQGAERLSEIVSKYFGAESLTLIDPDELDGYLTLLHRQNIFRVTPHSIKSHSGDSVVVIIHVTRESRHG